ncbi:NhaP-type Na+/H+ or K+/H+ antiporter [Streptacidiphilus sp. MAP12-16]|uniref:cation:proton antiporter n=1 Tax=Streptacidiphilus sp. MAP12-16 TaxID=3156300 RepID=UPI0035119902
MTTNQILEGLGLIVVLAVGSQLLASLLRIPALILLLPVGFTAGALTSTVNPDRLLGAAFSPMVSLAVAVILYDAGLGLDLRRLQGHTRRVVIRLIWLGVLITWVSAALLAAPLLGMSKRSAVMLGAILVVSGPTVVGPLLNFVRPTERLQRILVWEGSLIDPVGGILGALVFHAVVASNRKGFGAQLGQFAASAAVGAVGGAVGAALLWLLLRHLRLGEVLGTTVQLAAVVGLAAACDAVRDDTGLIAAVVMGMALANLPGLDLPARRPFFETLVSLIIGLLFISISATVTPQSLRHVVLPTLGLVAILVVVVRPLVAGLSTVGTDVPGGERWFIGWMAPRGIVAASTASTFSPTLVSKGIGGAEKILPATFVVIVATVMVYGLTAQPVARRLEVLRSARSRPLLVGGDQWAVDLGRALRSAGLDVLMWAGLDRQRERIAEAGLELAPGELLAAASGTGAELEGITGVLLLTEEDDFNALASMTLRGSVEGPVHRLGPPSRSHGVVAPYTGGETLFGAELSRPELARRYEGGARIVTHQVDGEIPTGYEVLFLVRPDGRLAPVTASERPTPQAGDVAIVLSPPSGQRPGEVVAGSTEGE